MEVPILLNDSAVYQYHYASLSLEIEHLKSEIKMLKDDLEEVKTENNYLTKRNIDLMMKLLKISPHDI
jgi:predicted  nucleic acid-binding Zn-ribbon protein